MTSEQTAIDKNEELDPVIKVKTPGWVVFILAIFYPTFTIGFELYTQMCAETLFDPMPTISHKVLISLVPLANFLVWKKLRGDKKLNSKWLMWLMCVSIGISGFYALIFLPTLPIAVIGILAFGLGLLPLAPLVSLIMGVWLYHKLKNQPEEKFEDKRYLLKGILTGLLLLVVVDIPPAITKWGVSLATSDSLESKDKGIRLLRSFGDKELLHSYCYDSGRRPGGPLGFIAMFAGQQSYVSTDDARQVYYQVTGQAFNHRPAPYRGGPWARYDDFAFDNDQGGSRVGNRIKNLELITSKIDGSVSGDNGIVYLEWTLEFKNDSPRQREARVQIALPPDAVVSRATLWINGEEREAAFAGKGKVREAYERVVNRRRDPLLVTSAGTDRVLAQAFPIMPRGGTIKFRLGITAPLNINNREGVSLVLPAIVDRNFGISGEVQHTLWIESKKELSINASQLSSQKISENLYRLQGNLSDIELSNPRKSISTSRELTLPQLVSQIDDNQQIIQQVVETPNQAKDALMVVVDGSIKSANYIDQILESLDVLPNDQKVGLMIASTDNAIIEIDNWTENQKYKFEKLLKENEFVGGQDNAPAITHALLKLEAYQDPEILWVHSPQPVVFSKSFPKLEQAIDQIVKLPKLTSYSLSLGQNKLTDKLVNDIKWNLNYNPIAKTSSTKNDLTNYISNNYVAKKKLVFQRVIVDEAKDVEKGSKHISRLWARDQIRSLMRKGIENKNKAIELAAKYQLVTLVSGAVVLENQQQYDENGLNPVDSNSVPTIPEPHQWILAFIILMMALWFLKQNKLILLKPR